jgi:hypothetical protein
MQVQRLAGLDARLLDYVQPPARGGFPRDVPMDGDADVVAELLTAADVVHYHNWRQTSLLFQFHPWAREIARRKPAVIQFHSPRAHNRWFEEELRDPGVIKLVVAQHHVRLFPECQPVPNAVPIDDPLHRPAGIHNRPPVIAFTPFRCGRRGWYAKGCGATLRVLRRGFRHRFATAVPWQETMEMRAQCDIAIDEVVTGSYHLCSLEALSLGLATVAGLDAQTVDALERVTGTRDHPWVVARLDTLEAELRRLVEDHAYRCARREAGRRYMERYWNPQAIVRHFTQAYAAALEKAPARW